MADWSLVKGDMDIPTDCAMAGITAIQVISEDASAEQNIDLFDCEDGSGETDPLPAGTYDVWINALDAGENLVARSPVQKVDVVKDTQSSFSAIFNVDGGYFYFTWTLVYGDMNPITCQDAGAASVEMVATLQDTLQTFEEIFYCTDGLGRTAWLPIGDYNLKASLVDNLDQPLGLPKNLEASIDYGNHINDLGNFEFSP